MISEHGTEKLFSMGILGRLMWGKGHGKLLMNKSFYFDDRSLQILLYKTVL